MLIGKFFYFQLWCSEGADRPGWQSGVGDKNTGDKGKNWGNKGASGISLLRVAKFQSTVGADNPHYATASHSV